MNMMKCDPMAFAKCPTRHLCGTPEDATFADGSECDRFNQKVLSQPMTNGDRFRAMNNIELAEFLADKFVAASCTRLTDDGYEPTEIEKENIKHTWYCAWLEWLRQPAEVE